MTNFDNNERILCMANFILENHTTIRATAKAFNIPKSTVHHDLSTKLKYVDYSLFKEVKKLLEENFSVKHIHGGMSTKIKYEKLKAEINKNDELDTICL
ncbi:MAG: sporulation transcriptional regulator SpoIIID [Clostridia bacterium]|nr:sporulation transcriptional regulator SpoIIID [Clostridia bacterium]